MARGLGTPVLKDEEVEIVFKFNGLGDWVIYDMGDSGFFSVFREAVIKHSLVHKVFLDFFTYAPPKLRSVSSWF